jgi:hypothetical protein
MGMFPKGTDNTDINKTARSNHIEGERFVAAATDFGATPSALQLPHAALPPHRRSAAPQPPKLLTDDALACVGALLLLNYPAVVEGGPFYIYAGHSSHVSNVKWLIP